MEIIGSKEELEWAKEALAHNCENCPCKKECNEAAIRDQEQFGETRVSCQEFMSRKIEFIQI